MRCIHCKLPVSNVEFKKAHVKRDDQGRLVWVMHNKCRLAVSKPRHHEGTPTAYEAAAQRRTADDIEAQQLLAARQAEVQQQREMDDDSRRWSDHRDPLEAEF